VDPDIIAATRRWLLQQATPQGAWMEKDSKGKFLEISALYNTAYVVEVLARDLQHRNPNDKDRTALGILKGGRAVRRYDYMSTRWRFSCQEGPTIVACSVRGVRDKQNQDQRYSFQAKCECLRPNPTTQGCTSPRRTA
jgi:hypothetical protein